MMSMAELRKELLDSSATTISLRCPVTLGQALSLCICLEGNANKLARACYMLNEGVSFGLVRGHAVRGEL